MSVFTAEGYLNMEAESLFEHSAYRVTGRQEPEDIVLSRSVRYVCRRGVMMYEGRTESHEQHFFARELGTADDGECGGRWSQLLCYP